MGQWEKMLKRFDEWGAPLRPTAEDVRMFQNELKEDDQVLLLGVTKELIPFATVAVDHHPSAVEMAKDKGVLADWKELPFENEFDVVMGDGCLTVFQGLPEQFFKQIRKVLKPNGRLVLRVFISPEKSEDISNVLEERDEMGFHAFKWRAAHALANPYVSVQKIYETVKAVRQHPTLEVYAESELIYYFPKLSQLPKWDFIQFGSSYELSERCPVVTWKMNSSKFPI